VGETGFPASADLRLDTIVTKKSRFSLRGPTFSPPKNRRISATLRKDQKAKFICYFCSAKKTGGPPLRYGLTKKDQKIKANRTPFGDLLFEGPKSRQKVLANLNSRSIYNIRKISLFGRKFAICFVILPEFTPLKSGVGICFLK